jgi:hypothetical protein
VAVNGTQKKSNFLSPLSSSHSKQKGAGYAGFNLINQPVPSISISQVFFSVLFCFSRSLHNAREKLKKKFPKQIIIGRASETFLWRELLAIKLATFSSVKAWGKEEK